MTPLELAANAVLAAEVAQALSELPVREPGQRPHFMLKAR